MKARLHARIDGHVQGVGFRAFVLENALELGLTGWVRNRWDGSVEVVAEGEREVLERLLSLLRRGPRAAYVSELKFDWLEAKDEFQDFRLRRTE